MISKYLLAFCCYCSCYCSCYCYFCCLQVLKHHPDKGGCEEVFKLVSEAHATLSEPAEKAKYDEDFHMTPAERTRRHRFSHHHRCTRFRDTRD